MKKFLLCTRYKADGVAAPDSSLINDCVEQSKLYLRHLEDQGCLVSSLPIDINGHLITKAEHGWKLTKLDPEVPMVVGYYIIAADDMHGALSIAGQNPNLLGIPGVSIEVREVLTDHVLAVD